MNSREDLHYNLREWPTGSESVDRELHEVIDRAFDLEAAVQEWAEALDVIHTKTFIGGGPHPELEAFQALERRLRDTALKGN